MENDTAHYLQGHERLEAAHHEAGHAIISMSLGQENQDSVQLDQPANSKFDGFHRRVNVIVSHGHLGRDYLEAILDFIVCIAGYIAECKFTDEESTIDEFFDSYGNLVDGDAEHLLSAASRITASLCMKRLTDAMFNQLWQFTVTSVNDHRIWCRIEHLASLLSQSGMDPLPWTLVDGTILYSSAELIALKFARRTARWHPEGKWIADYIAADISEREKIKNMPPPPQR